MKILFVSRHYPSDLRTSTYGTYQRMSMLIEAIKEVAQLDILFYVSPEIDISHDAILTKQKELSQHWNAPINLSLCHLFSHSDLVPKWRRHLQGVFNFCKQLLFFGTSGTAQVLAFEQSLNSNPDLIVIHRLGPMAPVLLTSKPLPAIILDLDDIEHVHSLRSLKQLPKQLEVWLYGLQIPALWWGELRAIRRANTTFVCSNRDQRYLKSQWHLAGINVIPNTVNIPQLQPLTKEPTLLFLASFQYQPNLQAAFFLLKKIWPYIYREMPEARLIIAGRESQKLLIHSKNIPGVEFTGFVENLDSLYQRIRVVCCPILSGGGTRIKMIEAAAYGKPIVSTTIGAEGLMMSNGKDFLLCDRPKIFSQACLELMTNDSLCEKLSNSARNIAIKYYNRPIILKNIQKFILDV